MLWTVCQKVRIVLLVKKDQLPVTNIEKNVNQRTLCLVEVEASHSISNLPQHRAPGNHLLESHSF